MKADDSMQGPAHERAAWAPLADELDLLADRDWQREQVRRWLKRAEAGAADTGDALQARADDVRAALLRAQYACLERGRRTVLLVISGIEGVGKGATINQLQQWLDPRHVRVMAFGRPGPIDSAYPALWRYWDALPGHGRLGVVFGSWYLPLMREAIRKRPDPLRMARLAEEIRRFEAMLAANGVVLVKCGYHLSRLAHAARIERLQASPATAWQVSERDVRVQRHYKRFRRAAALVMSLTDRPWAPWQAVSSEDDLCRVTETGEALLKAYRTATSATTRLPLPAPQLPSAHLPSLDAEDDDSAGMPKARYERELAQWQGRLASVARRWWEQGRSVALVFEGQDAAGKGGTIRRLTHALDVRQYTVHPISAPAPFELARPYLWRFWRRTPQPGQIAVFDRSWYGRVLVERVRRLAARPEWQRAYAEINNFERQWSAHGILVLKFWLHVSRDEQLSRFRERETSALKRYKITEEDWQNRRQWRAYAQASADMLAYTHTDSAPWHVVSSDDKRAARIAVLRAVVEAMESGSANNGSD